MSNEFDDIDLSEDNNDKNTNNFSKNIVYDSIYLDPNNKVNQAEINVNMNPDQKKSPKVPEVQNNINSNLNNQSGKYNYNNGENVNNMNFGNQRNNPINNNIGGGINNNVYNNNNQNNLNYPNMNTFPNSNQGEQQPFNQVDGSQYSNQNPSYIDPYKQNMKNYPYYSNYTNQLGQSIMNTTQLFPRQIDISCEDHKKIDSSIIQATRYCTKCKLLICDSCVIDYHIAHIDEAKVKIEEYCKSKKDELEELKKTNKLCLESKSFLKEVEENKNTILQDVNKIFTRREAVYLGLQSIFTDLKLEEDKIKKRIEEQIEIFFKEECSKRIQVPLQLLEKGNFLSFLII